MIRNKKLWKKVLEQKGFDSQLIITIEECSELSQAITKYLRKNEGYYEKALLINHIAEEIADVQIMTEQLTLNFDFEKKVKEIYKQKLERLKGRLKNEEGK